MKLNHLFLCIFAATFLVACSSDNDTPSTPPPDTTPPEVETTDYFPVANSYQWTYLNATDVAQQQNENEETITAKDTTVSSASAYAFSTNVALKEQGVMTLLLTNGYVTKEDGKLVFNGSFNLTIAELNQTIAIPVTDLVLYDKNAGSGIPLSTLADSYSQDFTFSGLTIPVTIDYILETSQGDVMATFNNGLQDYDDVISSNIKLSISASATIMGMSLDVIPNQEALQTTNYFANEVGLILSDSNIHLEFSDQLSQIPNIPELPTVDGTASQRLETYSFQ